MAENKSPVDVMSYLAPDNGSVFDHLTEVLTNVCINSSEKPVENFHKISREVLENSLTWSEEPAPLKLDLSKQAESTSLFQVQKPMSEPDNATAARTRVRADTYIPDIVAEQELLNWTGVAVGGVNATRIMLSVRQLAAAHPELKGVRFFGKILGRTADYYICEGEVTECDEAPPKGLKPNHEGKRNFEKAAQHNRFKYYVCSSPGAPWTALPNLFYYQLLAVPNIKRFFTGNLDTPMRTFPPFPGVTEAEYLRARIAHIAERTVISPAGFFNEQPLDLEATPKRHAHGIVPNPDWAPADDLSGYKAEAWPATGWVRHYPEVPGIDEFGEDFVPDETGKWPDIDPEPWPLRPLTDEEDAHLWVARQCSYQYQKLAPVCLISRLYPGAVTVLKGKQFVNFYIGMGNLETEKMYTPMFMEGVVMPPVKADDVYKVLRLPTVVKDEDGNVTETIAPEVKPNYPKEGWLHFNDEQADLRDKMYVEWAELKKKEEEERIAAEAAAAEAAAAEAAAAAEEAK